MALQPPLDRPVKRSSAGKGGKLPPLDQPIRRASKRSSRVFKGADGKVNSENIRGVSVGGGVSDQRKPIIGSRSLGSSATRKSRGPVQ